MIWWNQTKATSNQTKMSALAAQVIRVKPRIVMINSREVTSVNRVRGTRRLDFWKMFFSNWAGLMSATMMMRLIWIWRCHRLKSQRVQNDDNTFCIKHY